MEKLPTISAKISPDLLALVKAKSTESRLSVSEIVRDALALYFGMADQVSRDIPDVYQLRTEIEAIRLQLGELQVYTGYTSVYAPTVEHEFPADRSHSVSGQPIEIPTIITESLTPIELQPSNAVENNPIMTRAKDEAQSQTEFQPIEVDQDATTPNMLTTGELFTYLSEPGRGYPKKIRMLRVDLAKAAQVRQLPDDLIKLGVRANWDIKKKGKPKAPNLRWLWIERP